LATVAAAAMASRSSTSKCTATRLVMEVNSIAFRKAINSCNRARDRKFVGLFLERHIGIRVTSFRETRAFLGILDKSLAALVLLDLAGVLQKAVFFEIAILVDQLGGGLDADAAHGPATLSTDHLQRLD